MVHDEMVQVRELLAMAPREVTVARSAARLRFTLADDLVADHNRDDHHDHHDRDHHHHDHDNSPSVRPVEGEGTTDATGMGPVYRREPGGDVVVPTGRVLVRFDEHDPADNHRHALPSAGYVIEQVPSYAPHAAWVRAESGSIHDALINLERLGRLSGVVYVEPQMIGERRHRA